MSSLSSETSSNQSTGFESINHDCDIDFNALFLNPLIHLIDEKKQPSPPSFPEASTNHLASPAPIQACQNFQNSTAGLNLLAPTFPAPPSSSDANCQYKKLFVGNLPANTSFREVLDLFKPFGRVNEQLSTVKEDNYAFIHFYSEQEAERAQRALNDSYFKSRYIRVQYSTSRGHIKKSKTIDFREDFLQSKNTQLVSSLVNSASLSNVNLHQNNIRSHQLPVNSMNSRFPDSSSLYDFSERAIGRPITNRFMTKSSTMHTGFNASSSVFQAPVQSLLIPASSEANIQNQLQQLYQMQLNNQRKMLMEKHAAAMNAGILCSNANLTSTEFSLFEKNGTRSDLENVVPTPIGAHLVKSNTVSNFSNF